MEKRHPNHPGTLSTDARQAEVDRHPAELGVRARAVEVITEAGIPFLVGGAYAYASYTGIYRDTKDLDLFLKKEDAATALEVLSLDGWRTERYDEVWLYKAYKGDYFIDLIFSSRNGVAVVGDEWFTHAEPGRVFGRPVFLVPPEEMIWSKAFVLERERYDGADISHILQKTGGRLDWERLLGHFERYWEVLLSHLLLFRFAYPSDRALVPPWVMVELVARMMESIRKGNWAEQLCRGNLLSAVNYAVDIDVWGYRNGRTWDEGDRERSDEGSEREDSRRGGR